MSSPQPSTAPSHRRTSSAPTRTTPQISVEDTSQPLTNPEDPLTHRPSPNAPHNAHPQSGGHRRGSTWRRRSPGVGWKKRWDEHTYPWHNGRVLVVDCYSRDHSDDGRRKTQAYEFARVTELEEFYKTGPGRREDHVLRVIHVQNAIWAREFLLKKFNINSQGDDVVGTSFGRWAQYDKPMNRAGKPVLKAKSFRTSRDPWRGVSRTGFGVDYFKSYKPGIIQEDSEIPRKGFKFMELNHWEEENGIVPVHGYDVYVQRLSVYIQRNEGPVTLSAGDTDVKNPYIETAREWRNTRTTERRATAMVKDQNGSIGFRKESQANIMELLTSLDNGSTMIVFESSQTGQPGDTLIQAREEIEVRWRRLMFYLNKEEQSEDKLALECMDLVLRDIFRGLQMSWEKLLAKAEEHVDILEDKIYENPADESRAPELWTNSSLWLKLEKLMSLQISAVSDLQLQMRELSDTNEENLKEEWFKNSPSDLGRVAELIDEELIKPTTNLSDLMYKSVGIRDARYSIELGTSMWRLSWITFIFLPLTFIGGFFGMNVDLFQNAEGFPSIKWYFAASVPLMIIVVILYMVIKSSVSNRRDNPLQRGVYEEIYYEFATEHPQLWSRAGPRTYVVPQGFFSKLRWRIVKSWFHPSKTIARRNASEIDEMGVWARIKRKLAQRWLGQIKLAPGSGDVEHGFGDAGEFSTVTELLQMSAPVAMADAEPRIAVRMGREPFRSFSPRGRSRSTSGRRTGEARTNSPGSDMVVEEEKSDDDEKGKERGGSPARPSGARRSTEEDRGTPGGFLLNVPLNIRRGDEHAP